MVPAPVAARVTKAINIPTIGIGAGADTDGQILVWTDMAGLSTVAPRFSRTYADLRATLTEAASSYIADIRSGSFPSEAESFQD